MVQVFRILVCSYAVLLVRFVASKSAVAIIPHSPRILFKGPEMHQIDHPTCIYGKLATADGSQRLSLKGWQGQKKKQLPV
jgi:hypothetical protein